MFILGDVLVYDNLPVFNGVLLSIVLLLLFLIVVLLLQLL